MTLGAVLNTTAGTLASQDEQARQRLAGWLAPCVDQELTCWLNGGRAEPEAHRLLDQGAEGLIAGGGDGTISMVAGVAAEAGVPLGILPLGTRNHFARDLGIPTDIEAAVGVIKRMHLRRVDLGEINGRAFINNVSIGMYPEMVLQRAKYQRRRGWKKLPAHVAAAVHVLRRFPLSRLQVDLGDRPSLRLTPMFFVGNNAYCGGVLAEANRAALDTGKVWVCVARSRGKLALLRACWAFVVGRLNELPDLETELVDALTVHARRPNLTVAIDGETLRMSSPLHIRSRPGGLLVIAP